MASNSGFAIRPDAVADVSSRLDGLADRIDKVMQTEGPNLAATASGRDEVSQRVATTLNAVHTDFATSLDRGAEEVRQIAATLRGHTQSIVDVEQGFTV